MVRINGNQKCKIYAEGQRINAKRVFDANVSVSGEREKNHFRRRKEGEIWFSD
jgi:hypothetical protein